MTKKYSHIFNSTNKRTIILNPYRHYGNVIDNEERCYNLNKFFDTNETMNSENFSKYYDTRFINDSIRPARENKFIHSIEDLFSDDDDF